MQIKNATYQVSILIPEKLFYANNLKCIEIKINLISHQRRNRSQNRTHTKETGILLKLKQKQASNS